MQVHFPKFCSSDSELNTTYQYRCELYNRHVKQTPAGYVVTEFLPDVPWAGIYNTICCPAMHHFRDGRWLAESALMEDYAAFWCTTGNPHLYSFPLTDSLLEVAKVTGNLSTADALYPHLTRIHRQWDDHMTADGMYTQECDHDGMEYSISGDGLRPTLNAYMVAEGRALSLLATRAGLDEAATAYQKEADTLCDKLNTRLWNEKIGMYGTVSDDGVMQDVKEQVGYIPWIYGIPPAGRDGCFRYLLDTACFLSPYGLRTADASHPRYRFYHPHECLWNGPIWPFATSQTLTAVIEYLHENPHGTITSTEFTSLFLTYAYSHRDTDGSPWLDENMDPETGIWLAREILRQANKPDKARGLHYNHSSFVDLVMTGICGIRPSFSDTLEIHPLGLSLDSFQAEDIPYHGHLLQLEWDKKMGFRVRVDDKVEMRIQPDAEIKAVIEL